MEDKPTLPTKRQLTQEQNPSLKTSTITSQDRFSDLPYAIIHHILSFATVKDAIKICTLSRQWKSMWTSMSNLSFPLDEQNITHFASFVDKALRLYSAPKVKTFLLEFRYDDRFKRQFKSWIRFCATHEVEELYLHFTRLEALFFSKVFEWFDSWCGMSLKVLSLVRLGLGIEMIRVIFQGSPLMGCLKMRDCFFIQSLGSNFMIDATNTRLKILVLDSCSVAECKYEMNGAREGWVEIRGPHLLSLTVKGFMWATKLKLVDVSSLLEANFDFWVHTHIDKEEKRLLKGILEELPHVNRLAIGTWFLQVLGNMSLDEENFSPFISCKILKINVCLSKWYYPGMEFLLQISPSLEQLIINVVPHDVHKLCRDKHEVEVNYWRSKTRTIRCLNHNLERVEIIGFVIGNSSWNCGKILVEVVQFLLDNAKVLQKLTVHAQVDNLNTTLESIEPKKLKTLLTVKEQILHLPRASPDAVVLFKSDLL